MPLYLAPILNSQIVDANGDPNTGGLVETYLAGSTTPAAVYTTDSGSTPHTNPIVLNSLGWPTLGAVWLTGGLAYKFVIKNALGVTLRTIDNVSGINDAAVSQSEWVESGLTPTYIDATSFSVPGDQTGILQVNRRVRTQNTSGFIYSLITDSVFAAGLTTVTLQNDSGALDAGLSTVAYGLLSASPQSIPVVAVSSGGTGASTHDAALLSILNGNQLAGFRNLIINGNFAVNQRGYVSGAATTGANQYTLDRWRVVTSGQNITFSASANGRIVTAPAGGMEQVIEGANIVGGTYNISWTGTATCTVDGVAKTSGASFTLTAGTDATVRFTSGTVSLVQVEPGTATTAFEQRNYPAELLLCGRYFRPWEVGYSDATATSSTRYGFTQFPEMRTTPTVVNVAAIGTQANVSSIAFNDVTARGLRMDITPTASATVLCRRSITLSAEI